MDFVTSKQRRYIRSLRVVNKNMPSLMRGSQCFLQNILGNMLEFHPRKRISVNQAIRHPFFSPVSEPDKEAVSEKAFDCSFEYENLHRLKLQKLLWKEVAEFRPSQSLPIPPPRPRHAMKSHKYIL